MKRQLSSRPARERPSGDSERPPKVWPSSPTQLTLVHTRALFMTSLEFRPVEVGRVEEEEEEENRTRINCEGKPTLSWLVAITIAAKVT